MLIGNKQSEKLDCSPQQLVSVATAKAVGARYLNFPVMMEAVSSRCT